MLKIFSGKIFVIFIFSMSVFIRPEKIFSQLIPMPVTLEMMGETLEKYAYDFAGAMGFASSIGLSWSVPYMGQLVDMPPHWGLGLAVGTTTLKFDNLNRISEGIFGMRLNSDIMGKQFLSYYALEGRIGGFQNMPFDIGVKWGWLPSIPLADSFSLESLEYGADIRFALSQDWGYFPGVFLGIELDRTSGGISHDSAELIDKAIQTNGATSAMFYEAWVIDAKVGVAKTFYQPAITIFAGVKVGVSIAKAGYSITGDDI
ncbi:MAG: hypothetical protein LBV52_02015, partial [Spirochaetaceae bacterium]|nr:hypothetical protein [Spirochaetaceae bacterium]